MTLRPFEELVAEHGAVVMRVCRAIVGEADAQDAWSETFLAALRAYPDLRPDSNIRGWLVTIAHRKAIDQFRRSRRLEPMGDVPEIPSLDEPREIDMVLRSRLDALPPKQRGAVIYHYLAGLPYAEVGVLLESSEAAARRSAADGLANLRMAYVKEQSR